HLVQLVFKPFSRAGDVSQVGQHGLAIVYGGDGRHQRGEVDGKRSGRTPQGVQRIAMPHHRSESQACHARNLLKGPRDEKLRILTNQLRYADFWSKLRVGLVDDDRRVCRLLENPLDGGSGNLRARWIVGVADVKNSGTFGSGLDGSFQGEVHVRRV